MLLALADGGGHRLELVGDLGDQNRVCPTGNTCVEGNPAGVATHHFHHNHSPVGCRRGEQSVDALGGEADRRVKAERGVGAFQVVVDGLGYADDAQTGLMKVVADGERTVTADGDQCVDALLLEHGQQLGSAVDLHPAAVGLLRWVGSRVVAIGGAQNGAAEMHDAAHGLPVEVQQSAIGVQLGAEETVEAVADSYNLPATVQRSQRRRPDDRVQAWRIATAGGKGDAANR